MKKSFSVIAIVLIVLFIDQALKIWVKTSFCYGEERSLFGESSWAKLNFVENPGMAFGWKFGGEYGKLALSLFRIVAIGFLGYYVSRLVKRNANYGLLTGFSLILAGAIGNILDSAFYGLIFSESTFHCADGPAKMVAWGTGYGSFLHGKVVDMLFFPVWKNELGEVQFFQPVFNVADTAISVGVASILLFQRHYFSDDKKQPITTPSETEVADETENMNDEIVLEQNPVETPSDTEGVDFDKTETIVGDEKKENG
ncbi:MAG: lipoprotein signal peptidase [Saprospiraceae bacterium]|nr:lipoprotein signal peptidase [Saprospiraceae bacterium]